MRRAPALLSVWCRLLIKAQARTESVGPLMVGARGQRAAISASDGNAAGTAMLSDRKSATLPSDKAQINECRRVAFKGRCGRSNEEID